MLLAKNPPALLEVLQKPPPRLGPHMAQPRQLRARAPRSGPDSVQNLQLCRSHALRAQLFIHLPAEVNQNPLHQLDGAPRLLLPAPDVAFSDIALAVNHISVS